MTNFPDAQSHLAIRRARAKPSPRGREHHDRWNDVLFPLLVVPVSLHVRLSTTYPVAIRREGYHRSHRMAFHAHLGFCQSAESWLAIPPVGERIWCKSELGVVERFEQCIGHLLHISRQHSGLHAIREIRARVSVQFILIL